MKKHALITILSLYAYLSYSQNKSNESVCVDTAIVILKKYEQYNHHNLAHNFLDSYFLNDTLFYYSNRKIKKKAIPLDKLYTSGKFDVCRGKSYFLFYSKNGKLIAEGNWNIEGFEGICKEYYKTGNLEQEGYRNGDWKIKNWKYYNEFGKLIKEEQYDETGKLLSTKNY